MAGKAYDLHCDTLMKMAKNGCLDEGTAMVTLSGLRQGGVALQCFADFVPTGMFPRFCRGPLSSLMFRKLYKNYRAMMARYSDALFPVLCAADLDQAGEDGKIGVLLTIEDGGVMGNRLENVRKYCDMGVRLVTLTWNHPNFIGHPHSGDPEAMAKGLTDYGRQVVGEMERLGMVIDVSHGSDALFFQVAELAKKPFVASHSNARAVCGHTRNMRDDMIRLLADKGGVMGLNIGPDFLAEGSGGASRVEDMVRQILHIRKVGGSGVLALGSDFDGVRGDFEIAGPQDWPKLADALRKAGLPEEELEGMWWMNADRVLREALA